MFLGVYILNGKRKSAPDVSMTIGTFLSRANLKTFSSLAAIPLGLIWSKKYAIEGIGIVLYDLIIKTLNDERLKGWEYLQPA